jgi:sec-independent protein translocase protein TatA
MPFGIQPIHIVLVIVVALLIFGPKKLPEMGRSVGKAISEFRNGTKEMTDSLRAEVNPGGSAGTTNFAATHSTAYQTPTQLEPFQPPSHTAAPTGNFCIQCGGANPAEARFCAACGTKLPTVAGEPTNRSENKDANQCSSC